MKIAAAIVTTATLVWSACERAQPPAQRNAEPPHATPAFSPNNPTTTVADLLPTASVSPTPNASVREALQEATRRYFATSDENAHMEIIAEIAEIGDVAEHSAEAAETLGALFVGTRAADTKVEILDDLIDLKSPAAFLQVVTGLDKTQPDEVRLATIAALQFLEDKRAVGPLQAIANDPDDDVREAVQDALEGFKEQEAQ